MARSLNAPLSPHEEITLRRVALGVVDADHLSKRDLRRFMDLQLIIQVSGLPKLTPLGRQRYLALPRAAEISEAANRDLSGVLAQYILQARRQHQGSERGL